LVIDGRCWAEQQLECLCFDNRPLGALQDAQPYEHWLVDDLVVFLGGADAQCINGGQFVQRKPGISEVRGSSPVEAASVRSYSAKAHNPCRNFLNHFEPGFVGGGA